MTGRLQPACSVQRPMSMMLTADGTIRDLWPVGPVHGARWRWSAGAGAQGNAQLEDRAVRLIGCQSCGAAQRLRSFLEIVQAAATERDARADPVVRDAHGDVCAGHDDLDQD